MGEISSMSTSTIYQERATISSIESANTLSLIITLFFIHVRTKLKNNNFNVNDTGKPEQFEQHIKFISTVINN